MKPLTTNYTIYRDLLTLIRKFLKEINDEKKWNIACLHTYVTCLKENFVTSLNSALWNKILITDNFVYMKKILGFALSEAATGGVL